MTKTKSEKNGEAYILRKIMDKMQLNQINIKKIKKNTSKVLYKENNRGQDTPHQTQPLFIQGQEDQNSETKII